MQSVATYPQLPHTMTAAAPRGGFITYLRAGSLSVWLFTLVFPLLWVREWDSSIKMMQEGVEVRDYYYIGFAIACIAHMALGMGPWMAAPFRLNATWSGRLITMFCAVTLMVSPLSLVPVATAKYAFATWGVYLILFLYWQGDYRIIQRMTVLAGCVVLAWMCILALKLGLTMGLAIGGINRNVTGFAGMGGMICCMMSPKRSVRWAAIAIGCGLAAAVTSRGSLVALAVFLAAYYFVYKGVARTAMHGAIAMFMVALLVLVWPHLRQVVLEDTLMLHNQARGISSGFSGRFEAWKQAFDAFWSRPVFGYGFRATTHGGHASIGAVHSGYLKLFVETGFVGGFLIIGAVVIEAVRRFRLARKFCYLSPRDAPGINVMESARVNAIAFATIATTMVIWIYEQLYINLGSVISVVFFLMMVAPAYIASEQSSPAR